MNRWRKWRENLRRAERWEEEGGGDKELLGVKELFASVPPDDPAADARLWLRLRHRLAHSESAEAVASFGAAMLHLAPRFAAAGLLAFLLAAAVYWSAPPPSGAPEPATFAETAPAETAAAAFSFDEALEVRSGDELLRFIAYNPQTP